MRDRNIDISIGYGYLVGENPGSGDGRYISMMQVNLLETLAEISTVLRFTGFQSQANHFSTISLIAFCGI